jgi:hypothetical protein
MEAGDFLELATAYYKDKVERESIKKIHLSYQELLVADADARRQTAKEYILSMAKLRICLQKFEMHYNPIKEKYGCIDAAEKKVSEIKRQIRMYSDKKNHLR